MLIRKFFTNAKIHLCLFHTLKVFKKETQNLPSNVRDKVRKLLQDLAYSSSNDEYQANLALLKENTPARFINYFLSNWDKCKEMWVEYERNICSNFSNRTTNRLESYHQKLKCVLEGNKNLVEVMKSVVLLSSAKELMNDQLGFLQKVSRYYNKNHTDCSDAQDLYDVLTPYAAKKAEVELKKALRARFSIASEVTTMLCRKGLLLGL